MANRVVSVMLQAEIGQYVSGMTKAALATKGVGETAETTGRKAQKGFDLAGRGAQMFGLATAGALVGVITKSMDFEKSMSAVQAATQASAATMDQLRDAAIKAGADTQYSATEAADAITEMAKAGVSTADIMKGGLAGALNLAAAGQLDVADAAGIASTAMTQFNLTGAQLPHVADLLAAGAGKAMGSVDDMGQALNQAGLVASNTGISIEETTGALSAFASAGLIGSDAGTSFKTMLQQLQNPSKESAELMGQLGINAYDAQGNFVGLQDLAGQLQEKLSGLTQAERDHALAQIFGSDAVRAATVLYKEGAGGISEWTSKVNDAGYAQKQAAALTDNLSGDLERLGGSFDTLLISIGQGLQGPLREMVQMLGGLVDGVGGAVKVFADLPGPMQAAIAAAGLWAVAGGRISGIAGDARDKFRGFREEQELQRALFNAQQRELSLAAGDYSEIGQALERAGTSADAASRKFATAKAAAGGLARAIGPELVAAAGIALVSEIVSEFQNLGTAGGTARQQVDALKESLEGLDNAGRVDVASEGIDDFKKKLEAAREIVREADEEGWFDKFVWQNPFSDDYYRGVDDARASVAAYDEAIKKLETSQQNTDAATDLLSQRLHLSRDEVVELADKYGVDLSGSLDNVYGRFLLARASAEGMSGATDNANSSAGSFADEMDAVKESVDAAKQATDLYKLSLDILTGEAVDITAVESAFWAAVDGAKTALDGATGSVLDNTGALDLHSEAGRKTRDTLVGIADDANNWIATMISQGATMEDVQAKDAQLRQNFYDTALQMTGSKDAAQALTDKYYGIPGERETKIKADIQQAQGAVAQIQTDIDNLRGKTVLVSVRADGTISAILGSSSVMSRPGMVVGYSDGGYTGPGGKKQPAGVVHAGEVVWSQDDVAAHGGPRAVDMMRKRRGMPGYADGGIVVDINDRALAETVRGVKKGLEPATAYFTALRWARSQVGKPYVWGSAGPGGYDCSGFMSALTNYIRGRSPYSRLGSTATFPWPGFASGNNGLFNIGSIGNAGGGIGHMAGTLLGVNVESAGGVGVRVGASARGASSSLFSTRAHLALASGGVIGEPVVGQGLWSGRSYSFAERGDEVVLPRGREVSGGGRGGATVVKVAAPDLRGLTIQGRVTVDGDGIATIAGRVVDNALGQIHDDVHYAGG